MSSPTTVRRTRSERVDGDAVAEFLSTTYSSTRLSRQDHQPGVRHQRVDAGTFALDDVHFLATFDYQDRPLNAIVASWATTACGERTSGDISQGYNAGDVFLSGYPDLPYGGKIAPGEFRTAGIDLALIDQIVAAAPSRRPAPPRITGLTPISTAAATRWCAARAHVADLFENLDAVAAPLVVASAGRLLAAATLHTFPNTALTDPTIEDRHDATAQAVRKAVSYIETHAADDICVADIAAAAHVGIRAIQLAFRRHYDTTPMAYLRRVRLDRARHDLLDADPTRTTVTTIAARWGFTPNRFAPRYRAAYGQPPSHTLHNN